MGLTRMTGVVRRHGRLVAVVAALALLAGVVPLVAPGHGGSRPAGVLAPGSMGSLRHYPWWDPRGWFGHHGAPGPRVIAAAGGPQTGRTPRQAALPPARRLWELTADRSANTRTYQLSDGRLQAVVSSGPVNYRDARGRWQPIDTTVRPIAEPGYQYGNVANTFGSFFGAAPGRLVRFAAPSGGWLVMGLDGGHAARPVVSGNTVTYRGVAAGASLSYRVTPTSLKEGITLASPSAAPSLSFTVRVGGGLVAYQRAGQIVFSRTGVGGPAVAVMPKPFMTDARRDPSSPYGLSWSPRVAERVRWDPVAVCCT